MKHKPIIRFPDIKATHHPNRENGKVYLKGLLKGIA